MTSTAPRPALDSAAALSLLAGEPFVALTGAGLSTDSGIPDYRGPHAPARRPMTYQEFVATPGARRHYWARAHVGWSLMGSARPNAGHHGLVRLEALGRIRLAITQNVDGLHEAAGSQQLCALHGRISEVVCLSCGTVTSRHSVSARLSALNPEWLDRHAESAARPDGDVELRYTEGFLVPDCPCGGPLKPGVVFFGENVPKDRVQRCYDAVEETAARGGTLLVLGSSLTVMSGLRFVRRAAKLGMPVVIVNRGATRGDEHATVKLDVGTSEFLRDLADALGPAGGVG